MLSNLFAHAAEQIGLAAAPLIAVLVLHDAASATALLQAAATIPFLLFALPAGLLADRFSRAGILAGGEAIRAITVLVILALLASLLMVSTLWSHAATMAGVAFCFLGAVPILWVITTTPVRQAVTPERMLGRVSAIIMMTTAGVRPVGAGVAALVAAPGGAEWCIGVAAVGFALQAHVIVRSPAAAGGEQAAHHALELTTS